MLAAKLTRFLLAVFTSEHILPFEQMHETNAEMTCVICSDFSQGHEIKLEISSVM